jgi:nucleoside-diphosphate-sugar epimerase
MPLKILISGAGGYIGSKMVEIFLAAGHEVVAMDRYFFGDNLADLQANNNISIIRDDIRLFDKSVLTGVDVVIDLASISNDPASELLPAITNSINYEGAVRIARIAKEMGVKKFIFSSSCSVYGAGENILNEQSSVAPISTYAKCKLLAEADMLALSDANFSVTILRNGTVYGLSKRRMRFDLIVNLMTSYAWKNRKIYIMGGGKQWRPLVHVDDVIKAFRMVAEEEKGDKINGQIFNVGSNEQNYQVFQVAHMFPDYFDSLVIEETPDDPDPRNYHVSFDKIQLILGYKTDKTVHDGIKEIKDALDKTEITDNMYGRTVDFYRYLIEADKILARVKLNGVLF